MNNDTIFKETIPMLKDCLHELYCKDLLAMQDQEREDAEQLIEICEEIVCRFGQSNELR